MIQFKEAFDAYAASDRYKEGADPNTLKAPPSHRQYLENRLYWAFREGWKAARDEKGLPHD